MSEIKDGDRHMDVNKIVKDVTNWFKIKKNMYGLLGFIAIIAILAMDFSYWAAHVSAIAYGEQEEIAAPPLPAENYTIKAVEALNEEGYAPVPDAGTGAMAQEFEFVIEKNATKAIINLTHTGGGGIRPDLDLYIYDPKGKQVGSSASPEADESAVLDEKTLRRSGPGTYKAVVDPYTGVNIQFTITAVVYYKVPVNESCVGEVCE